MRHIQYLDLRRDTGSMPLRFEEMPACRNMISEKTFEGRGILCLEPHCLELIAEEAFKRISFFLPEGCLDSLDKIIDDPESSQNDRYVAASLIENALISSQMSLPLCQDTGAANVFAWKGGQVFTGADDRDLIAEGVRKAWSASCLRNSMLCPSSFFEETNSGSNLPAQIEIESVQGSEYSFFFLAKGGGSSNKTFLFQESKAILEPGTFEQFLSRIVSMPGVAACPPYHVGIAVGGTSPEIALKAAKLAAAGYYDGLSDKPLMPGGIFRSPYWERKLLSIADKSGLGAQFGGKYFVNSATVLRLPRHAASCHVGMAVSCVAHRRISAYVGRDGVFLEKLDANPERFADKVASLSFAEAPLIRLDRPICEIRKLLSQLPPGTRLRLSGPMIVARDSACMRMAEELASSGRMPECVRDAVVYHAGPARTPPGMPCGSFGPTTAQRMDPYLDRFMNAGAFLITLAKGDRGATARDAFRKHGAFYLGTIGGAAALIAKRHVLSSEIVGYEDLGMEALRRIVVNDLPAFVICDDKGCSLYDRYSFSDK